MVRQQSGAAIPTETFGKRLGRLASVAYLPLMAAALIARTTQLIVASSGDDMVVGSINQAEDTTLLFTDVGDTSSPVLFILGGDSRPGDPIVNGIEAWGGNSGTGVVGVGDIANDGNGLLGFGSGSGTGVSGEGDEGNGPGVTGFGGQSSGPGVVGHGGGGLDSNADGVQGFGFGKGFGVIGHGGFAGATGVIGFGGLNGQGVAGIGTGVAPGVVGVAGDFSQQENADGVQGFGARNGVGAVGRGGASNGTGVLGFGGGRAGQGVAGIGADSGPGVVGVGGNFNKESTADGVQGFGQGTFSGVAGWGGGKSGSGVFGAGGGPNGAGVHGQGASSGPGVFGTAAGFHGIVGTTAAAKFGGVFGNATATGAAGIYGSTVDSTTKTNVASAYAGYFDGNMVVVHGVKSAAVPHQDGTYRLLYCMESPESWFEDFGEGTLTGGRADVRLDPDFAAVVETSGYHVFLTAHTIESEALAVIERRADTFVVMERNRGASNGTFSWRLVAKRKDVAAERLAKIQLLTPAALPAASDRAVAEPAHRLIEARALPERVRPPAPRTPAARPQRLAKPSNGTNPRE